MAIIINNENNQIQYKTESLSSSEIKFARELSLKFTMDFYNSLEKSLDGIRKEKSFNESIKKHLEFIFLTGFDEAAKKFKPKDENKEDSKATTTHEEFIILC